MQAANHKFTSCTGKFDPHLPQGGTDAVGSQFWIFRQLLCGNMMEEVVDKTIGAEVMAEGDNDEQSCERRWLALEAAYKNRTPVRARICETVPGKVSVDVDGFPGVIENFVWGFTFPAGKYGSDKDSMLQLLQTLKGKMVLLRIVEIDPVQESLKLSQRLYSDDVAENARREAFLLEKLQSSDVCTGIVKSVDGMLTTVYLDGVEGKLRMFDRVGPAYESMRLPPLEIGQEVSVEISRKDKHTLWLRLA